MFLRGAAHTAQRQPVTSCTLVHARNWSLFGASTSTSSPQTSHQNTTNAQTNGGTKAAKFDAQAPSEGEQQKKPRTRKKTMAQLDEEMRLAMEGRAGDGGESGLELEDGKPVSMKRGVRDNMFRYI